jgi:phosphonate transport system substrate-binding protein
LNAAPGMRSCRLWACLAGVLLGCPSGSLPEVDVQLRGGPTVIARAQKGAGALRVSVAAMMSPSGTFGAYRQLLDQLGAQLGSPVELVQRRTYRETNDLLASNSIDIAFICTGGLIELQATGRRVEILAVPVIHGVTTYRSVIIVPAHGQVGAFADLAGKRFAFTDELSLSGYAWPVWLAGKSGHDPMQFFSNTYFTHSHDRSIDSVAKGLVDGAAVDSVILAKMQAQSPALAETVRVLGQSDPLGMPPVVASDRANEKTRAAVRQWLITLHEKPEGRQVLDALGIERFAVPEPGLYELATEIARGVRP